MLAAVDVGTNSFHLVVARVVDSGHFEVVTQEKEMVRLGSGAGDMKQLERAAITRGVKALARFRRLADAAGAPLRAVATSAVREADNAQAFLERARVDAGVEVEVISGVEEARLIHLGVLQGLDVYDRRLLLCDIGGGSTELLLGERSEVLASRSFKLGAVRLTNRFFPSDLDHPSSVEACRTFVRAAIQPMVREVAEQGFEVAIGSSGTIEQLAQLANGGEDLRSYGGFVMSTDALDEVVSRLIAARSASRRRKIPGLDPKRADIILAGALIYEQVAHSFGITNTTISSFALREGVLLDTLHRTTGGYVHHLQDVSRRSVVALMEACDDEPEHSRQVATLSLQLFDATRRLHSLGPECREYLEAAALLANVGLVISHSKHHLHSYYVIRNSERLVGFTDAEIEIIAQVARYHRKSAPKPSHPEFAGLTAEHQHIVRTLAGILRVAIGLDRSHANLVSGMSAARRGDQLTITVEAKGDPTLELYSAQERSELLAANTGLRVKVRAAGAHRNTA